MHFQKLPLSTSNNPGVGSKILNCTSLRKGNATEYSGNMLSSFTDSKVVLAIDSMDINSSVTRPTD